MGDAAAMSHVLVDCHSASNHVFGRMAGVLLPLLRRLITPSAAAPFWHPSKTVLMAASVQVEFKLLPTDKALCFDYNCDGWRYVVGEPLGQHKNERWTEWRSSHNILVIAT